MRSVLPVAASTRKSRQAPHGHCASFAEAQGGCASETKPCLLFQGAEWEQQADLISLRSVRCDFFQLQVVDAISSTGLEHVLSFTAHDGKVLGRH